MFLPQALFNSRRRVLMRLKPGYVRKKSSFLPTKTSLAVPENALTTSGVCEIQGNPFLRQIPKIKPRRSSTLLKFIPPFPLNRFFVPVISCVGIQWLRQTHRPLPAPTAWERANTQVSISGLLTVGIVQSSTANISGPAEDFTGKA